MAQQLIEQWELAVLRVRLDLSARTAVVASELLDYASGVERSHWKRSDSLDSFGLNSGAEPPRRLGLPTDLGQQLAASLQGDLHGEAALWLRLVPPYGYLGAVPWEDVIDTIGVPLLRVPDRLPLPAQFGRLWTVAVAINAAGLDWGADHVRTLFGALRDELDGELEMEVFADSVTAALLNSGAEVDQRLRIHQPSKARAAHDARRARAAGRAHPDASVMSSIPAANQLWADWIADGLDGRAVRALHVASAAIFDDGRPMLTIGADPAEPWNPSTCGFVVSTDIDRLAGALGATVVSIGSPPANTSDPASRMLADTIGQTRPGPTLYSRLDQDPGALTLAAAHAFLSDPGVRGRIPRDGSLFGYVQPEAVKRVIGRLPTALVADDDLPASEAAEPFMPMPPSARPGISDTVARSYRWADTVPSWVAASSRFVEAQNAQLVRSGEATEQTAPSRAAYDLGARAALDEIQDFLNRHGAES